MKEVKRARAAEWGYGMSSNNNEQIGIRFDVVDGSGHPTGESEMWYGTFTDKAWPFTCDALKHCGWDGKSLETLDGMGSKDVQLVIMEEEFEGQTQRKVKYINALGGVAMKAPLSDGERRSFFARMQQRLSGGRQASLPPAGNKKSDDEIPF